MQTLQSTFDKPFNRPHAMPMVIQGYRGTFNPETQFRPCNRGTFGRGIYFATDTECPLVYGDYVHQALITLNNPWVIHGDYDLPITEEVDFDCPCIEAVLSLPGGRAMVDKAKATDGYFGRTLQRTLQSLGYDGILQTYHDGSQEVVAFDREQIHYQGLLDTHPPASALPDIKPAGFHAAA